MRIQNTPVVPRASSTQASTAAQTASPASTGYSSDSSFVSSDDPNQIISDALKQLDDPKNKLAFPKSENPQSIPDDTYQRISGDAKAQIQALQGQNLSPDELRAKIDEINKNLESKVTCEALIQTNFLNSIKAAIQKALDAVKESMQGGF